MNKIKTIFRKIKYNLEHNLFSIDNIILIMALILCSVWTYQSIVAMSRNWELSERLATEYKNLELIKLEVESAELENEYYKTDEYQELIARRDLDKKSPGENLVILPSNSETAKNKHKNQSPNSTKDQAYSNFEIWMKYLFPNF